MKILITGVAGFIGSTLVRRLMKHQILQGDICMNLYKKARAYIKKIDFVREFVYNLSPEMDRALADCSSVLDIGCGGGDAYSFFNKNDCYAIGIDIVPEQLNRAQKRKIYNKLLQEDVRKLGNLFPPESFDAVIALDLIEHLSREDSEKLLKEMELIAKKKVIVITPNGKTKGNKPNIPFMQHLCGWTPAEFRNRGYRVWGGGGWKKLRNQKEFLWGFSSGCALNFQKLFFNLTQPFVVNRPELAFGLICILEK